MDQAQELAAQLLSGQVGNPFAGYGSVGNYPSAGDLVQVTPFYPGGGRPAAGTPNVQPFYVGVPAEATAPNASGQQVSYSPPQYVAGDVTYLGFAATVIPAGSVGTPVNVSTQRPFTPQKMGCPSTTIGLLITQINISGTNLLANNLGIPIEIFSEVSMFPQILWPTLDTATGVQFVVANPGAAPLTFSGAFYGTQVRR